MCIRHRIRALAFVAGLGPGIENAVPAIALTAWPPYARVARAETLTVRNSDYIAAIRLQGAGHARIIAGHVVPMCLPSVIIRVTLDMAGGILMPAGLGVLGLWGAATPAASQRMAAVAIAALLAIPKTRPLAALRSSDCSARLSDGCVGDERPRDRVTPLSTSASGLVEVNPQRTIPPHGQPRARNSHHT